MEVTVSLISPLSCVSDNTLSRRRRLSPFCVPTQMFCSVSSKMDWTKSLDKPSLRVYRRTVAFSPIPETRRRPSFRVPIQRHPELSDVTLVMTEEEESALAFPRTFLLSSD